LKNLLIIFAATIAISPAFSSAVPTPKVVPQKQVFMNKFEHAFKFKQITNKTKTRKQTFYDLFKKFENTKKVQKK